MGHRPSCVPVVLRCTIYDIRAGRWACGGWSRPCPGRRPFHSGHPREHMQSVFDEIYSPKRERANMSAALSAVLLAATTTMHPELFERLRQLGGYVHPSLEAVDLGERGTGLRMAPDSPRLEAGEMVIGLPPALQLSWSSIAPGLPLVTAVNQLLPDPE
eukprot:7387655-Prymnesium_polylepis.1